MAETVQTQTTTPFDEIWAILQENAQQLKETDQLIKETDRLMKENAEKQEKRSQELDRQFKERSKEFDRRLSKLGDRFGEMVEYMVMPNLLDRFRDLGYEFEKAYQNTTIKDSKNNIITEVDVTLENGDKVMITEVKTKPSINDIIYHKERMEKIRAYADLHNDKRKFFGAIAGMVFNENEKKFALKNGFYVLEPSGEAFIITAPEGDYSPREW